LGFYLSLSETDLLLCMLLVELLADLSLFLLMGLIQGQTKVPEEVGLLDSELFPTLAVGLVVQFASFFQLIEGLLVSPKLVFYILRLCEPSICVLLQQ